MSFFNLYNFDGRLSRDRNQEAMFNSLNERERFLEKMEQDRAARTHETKKNSAAIKIQKFILRETARRSIAQEIRESFDIAANLFDQKTLITQTRRLNLFYNFFVEGDNDRLQTHCSKLHKAAKESIPTFLPDNSRILLCQKILQYISQEDAKKFSRLPISCLRFMESFCTESDYAYLALHGWYAGVIKLIQASIPEDGFETVQDSLPHRVDTLLILFVTPAFQKTNSEGPLTKMFETIFNNLDMKLMFSVILPYIARTIITSNNNDIAKNIFNIEISTENSILLRCHFCTLLLQSSIISNSPIENTGFFHSFAQSLPHWIINNKKALEDGLIENFLRSFINSDYFLSFFAGIIRSPFSDEDLKVITKISSLCSSSILDVMCSTPLFMERLYSFVTNMKTNQISLSRSTTDTYVNLLFRGTSLTEKQRADFIPSIMLLSSLICHFVDFTFDEDFGTGGRIHDALTCIISSTRLIRDVTLGLIDLAFPGKYWTFNTLSEQRKADEAAWNVIYDQLVKTLQSVHRKNNRVSFLPDGFWTDHGRQIIINHNTYMPRRERRGGFTPFLLIHYLFEDSAKDDDLSDSEMDDDNKPQLTTGDLRNLSIIRSIPFILLFDKRLKIFQELIEYDRRKYLGGFDFGYGGNVISISVRRQYLYDDSFVALSPGEASNLRLPIRVRMVNWAGANESGVDGGGIFREFLSELLKTGLDPERGLFCYTHDRLLYPNPIASSIFADSFSQHYYFLGRMLAKLIYEGMMLDVRFADFFLVQLLGYRVTNIDLEQMKSCDPNVYKHLRDLLKYTDQELAELGLDFSVTIDTVGKIEVVELKKGGQSIPVTKTNLREYIQLYVNYHLMKRISPMVDAMRAGVSNVIEPVWLGMFDPAEIQVIVSGIDAEIDVEDMKNNTVVYPCEGVNSLVYMNWFWKILSELPNEDKAALLKFITGCPRPPIDGFRSLSPNIAIQLNNNDSNLLPTSATCMNLLKLPVYESINILKDKIKYAIYAGAGFELA